jgi:hypothetical protein
MKLHFNLLESVAAMLSCACGSGGKASPSSPSALGTSGTGVTSNAFLTGAATNKNAAGTCSPDGFSSAVGNPISCCQDGNRTWDTRDGRTLAFRVHAAACTEADGVGTNCGVGSSPFVQCTYGPCGARIEWAVTGKQVHIFGPVSMPNKCGWEVENVVACRVGCDWPAGAVREYPEPFVDQIEYGSLTATCSYSNCLVGGIPARSRLSKY